MLSCFVRELGFPIQKPYINLQKIDDSRLDTIGIVIAFFSVDDKDERFRFFEETFLLASISIDVCFEIFFLTLKNIKINFIN